ncbi:MAG: hypothetical protein NTZ84_03405 [Candidatus Nealsonbacteria bacterium]|nr:hypothetical protein [Candidatus Nealsonbacteria bacterium]
MTNEFKTFLELIVEELEHIGGNQITLYEADLFNAGLKDSDIRRALEKLVADKLIDKKPTVKYAPNKKQPTNPMHADFTSSPNAIYNKLAYDLSVNKKKIEAIRQKLNQPPTADYVITLTKTRDVILNGKYLLSKPHFNSENEIFFQYVYTHPNKKITRKEVADENKTEIKKSFQQIITDLGFTGYLRKMFFPNISISATEFRQQITKSDLSELGIDNEKLESELKKLNRIDKK